ncbi:MAG: alpha/beta hydrolase fold domain-containing protein [Curvibacter lanceolatus]|jgi:cation diffusion facilitator CzcD-associated flavoprotein CzcO/acetyl esterase/lipase|uniref:flavin-containing monooxygenase n=1 Tax=Curvibacter lanceolatus TaxID=86182 RepID=UPI0023523BA9|nr:alpha/beta hydrolase fold domain-containing protein [Curvibacter lanceolatus]MBV5291479.1 alpha/beta hydrolase fold domain-containing protein [Curvibacter lanceolatus]
MTSPDSRSTAPLSALIIGTGFAGLGMAIALRKAGIHDFLIVEKSQDVGGVWRDNAYPGAACDVPSHLYSFSFEPNPHWSRVFAPQAEIHAYLRHCATRYELHQHIRFGCEVASAAYDEGTCLWRVTLTDGRVFNCTWLISGTGQLSRPALPALEGLASFKGPSFHSAHWDHAVPLAGRRVAVVGTGASAIQFVPAIAPQAGSLHVFQRSPAYMMPRPDRPYSPFEKQLFRVVPGAAALHRAWIYLKYESRALAFTRFKGLMKGAVGAPFQRMLMAQVPQADLRQQLTPDYPIGCKRILLSSEYLATMARPNVKLHTTGIRRVHPDSIETLDGQRHPVDVIVYGTGFAATQFLSPMRITGKAGLDLNEAWRDGAAAYLGMTVAGFPNFFMLYGPNTNLGHNSIVYMIESQIAHVMRCIRAARRVGAAAIEVDARRYRAHALQMREALRRTVWNGCTTWYTDANGHSTTNWPGFTFTYRWQTRHSSLAAYRFERPRGPGLGVAVAPPQSAVESLQAHLLRKFLQVGFRTLIGPPFGPKVQRGVVALLSPLMPGVGGVLSERHTLGGVPTQVLAPQRDDRGTAVLYLHGGAFCLGGPTSHRSITTRLARDGGFTVHVPDYRLAPEHPHPAPLEDALAAYEGLLQQGWPAQRIVLAGDSAGGALALSLAQALKQRGQPLPAAMLLISPVVDTTLATAKAAAPHVHDPMLRMGWLEQGLRWHGAPPAAPSVDDLAGLPPLLLQVGDQELLLADAELLARRAQAAGVACTLEVYQGRWHVFHLQAAYLASARAALQSMIRFAQAHGQARPARAQDSGSCRDSGPAPRA